ALRCAVDHAGEGAGLGDPWLGAPAGPHGYRRAGGGQAGRPGAVQARRAALFWQSRPAGGAAAVRRRTCRSGDGRRPLAGDRRTDRRAGRRRADRRTQPGGAAADCRLAVVALPAAPPARFPLQSRPLPSAVPRSAMPVSFVHLRLHTEFSLVDGLVRVKPLVKAVAAAGMPAVAVTEINNMHSLVQFYKAANGAGIKPI